MKIRLHVLLLSCGLLLAAPAFGQTGLISFNFGSFGSSALSFDGQRHLTFSPDSTTGQNHGFQIASDALSAASGLGGLYGDISDPTQNSTPSQYTIGTITTNFGVSAAPITGGKGLFSIYDQSGQALTAKVWWVSQVQVGAVGGLNLDGTMNLSDFAYNGSDLALQTLAAQASGTSVISFQFPSPVTLGELAGPTAHTTNFSGSFSAIPEPSAYAVLLGGTVLVLTALRRHRETPGALPA